MLNDKRIALKLSLLGIHFSKKNIPLLLAGIPSSDSSDIDIFILSNDKSKIRLTLKSINFMPSTMNEYFFAIDENNRIVPFHLKDSDGLFNFEILEWFFKKSSLIEDGVYLLNETTRVANKLIRDLHINGRYRPKTLIYVKNFISTKENLMAVTTEIHNICELLNRPIEPYIELLNLIRFETPSEELFNTYRESLNINNSFAPSNQRKEYFRRLNTRIKSLFNRLMFYERMPIIAFIGIDGAGKTRAIESFYIANKKIRIKKFNMRGQEPYFFLSKLLTSVNHTLKKVMSKLRLKPFLLILVVFGDFLDWLDRLGRTLIFSYYSRRGVLCLIDRYSYDKYINLMVSNTRSKLVSRVYSWIIRIFFVDFIKKADLTIYLCIDGPTSFERKGEYTEKIQDEKNYYYDKLFAHKLNNAHVKLDGNQKPEEIDSQVSFMIYSQIETIQRIQSK